MPIYKSGDIWSQYNKNNSVIFVTTCGVLTKSGLVMGAGSALDAKKREPKLPIVFASAIHTKRGFIDLSVANYGLLFDPNWNIGAFQTKYHFKSDSSVELIHKSTKELKTLAELHDTAEFNLCFPGVGFGRLNPEYIKPILAQLPDNVIVWSR